MRYRKIGLSIICILSFDILSAANGLDTWSGTTNSSTGTSTNWAAGSANAPPISGDSLLFPSPVTTYSVNNNIASLTVTGITINSDFPYTISQTGSDSFSFSNGGTLAFQDLQGGHTISANIAIATGGQ